MRSVGRKIMAMVNPPKTSSVSFGRTNNEPDDGRHDHQPSAKATLTGEDLRTTVGQHAEQEDHDRLFADVRGPKDQARKEENQIPVAAIADPAEREREGTVVARDSDEGEEAHDQECSGLVDSDNGEQTPATMLIEPLSTIPPMPGGREKLKWRKPGCQLLLPCRCTG